MLTVWKSRRTSAKLEAPWAHLLWITAVHADFSNHMVYFYHIVYHVYGQCWRYLEVSPMVISIDLLYLVVSPREKTNKQTCFSCATDPNFFVLADFVLFCLWFCFCFLIFPKSAVFWPKSSNFSWKFLKISPNIFPNVFSNFFFEIFMLLGSFSYQEKKNARPTDRPTLLGKSVHP